ncbi:hypothetical protein K0M31_018300 [Melipona bicolor]|uniref:Uncharacterized protein n=1 Tax=Melipona bicolor TaxID=60889 RepID=A0AA40FCQ3_9HYME|nr:hypothetical protein K0M31_018300 [Melipona bicolor]
MTRSKATPLRSLPTSSNVERASQFDFQKSSRPDRDVWSSAIGRWTREEERTGRDTGTDKIAGTSGWSTGPRHVLSRDVRENDGARVFDVGRQGRGLTANESTMHDVRLTFSLRETGHDNNRFNSVVRLAEIAWKPPSTCASMSSVDFPRISRSIAGPGLAETLNGFAGVPAQSSKNRSQSPRCRGRISRVDSGPGQVPRKEASGSTVWIGQEISRTNLFPLQTIVDLSDAGYLWLKRHHVSIPKHVSPGGVIQNN